MSDLEKGLPQPSFVVFSSSSVSLGCSEGVASETREGGTLTQTCWSEELSFLHFDIINPLRV